MQSRVFEGDNCVVGPAGELILSGINLGRLARDFNTPFYLISERILENNYQRLVRGFSGVE
ncbi:MAG: hypothetical protein ACE5I8_07540, partial [Thermodesulfobacteriota bacterium]